MQGLIHSCLEDFGQCLSDPRLSGLDSLIAIIAAVTFVVRWLMKSIGFAEFVFIVAILAFCSAVQSKENFSITKQPSIQIKQQTLVAAKYFNLHWRPNCEDSPEPVVELLKAPEDECLNSTVETWDLDYLAKRLREIGLLNPNEHIQPSAYVGRPQNESIEILDQNDVLIGYINIQRNSSEEFGSVWRQQPNETIPVSNKCRLTWEYKWECLP
jgi:hypothetical protein